MFRLRGASRGSAGLGGGASVHFLALSVRLEIGPWPDAGRRSRLDIDPGRRRLSFRSSASLAAFASLSSRLRGTVPLSVARTVVAQRWEHCGRFTFGPLALCPQRSTGLRRALLAMGRWRPVARASAGLVGASSPSAGRDGVPANLQPVQATERWRLADLSTSLCLSRNSVAERRFGRRSTPPSRLPLWDRCREESLGRGRPGDACPHSLEQAKSSQGPSVWAMAAVNAAGFFGCSFVRRNRLRILRLHFLLATRSWPFGSDTPIQPVSRSGFAIFWLHDFRCDRIRRLLKLLGRRYHQRFALHFGQRS